MCNRASTSHQLLNAEVAAGRHSNVVTAPGIVAVWQMQMQMQMQMQHFTTNLHRVHAKN